MKTGGDERRSDQVAWRITARLQMLAQPSLNTPIAQCLRASVDESVLIFL
jgi:hypothetical protein